MTTKRQVGQRAVTDYLPLLHGLLQQQQQPVWGWSHEWWRHSDNTSACRVYSTQWAQRRTTSVALQTRPIIRAVHVRPHSTACTSRDGNATRLRISRRSGFELVLRPTNISPHNALKVKEVYWCTVFVFETKGVGIRGNGACPHKNHCWCGTALQEQNYSQLDSSRLTGRNSEQSASAHACMAK